MNLSLRRHFARGRSHGSQPFRLRHFKPLFNLGGLGEQFLGGHGVALGLLDLSQCIEWTRRCKSVLLGNPGHGNHWLGLKLEGVDSNRSAIGARVALEVSTPTGPRTIHRVVNSGTSFGDSPLELHIRLGNAKSIRKVEVHWPSGKVTSRRNLTMDFVFRLRENSQDATRIHYTKFSFINDDEQLHRH